MNRGTKASLQFDLIAPVNQGKYTDWSRMGFCMVRLANETDLKKYNEKISKPQSLICYSHSPIQYGLTPLKGLYFNKIVEPSAASFAGNINHVTILTVVACMLLLVGVFNFINIYTVIVLKRAREFGVKSIWCERLSDIYPDLCREYIYGGSRLVYHLDADRNFSRDIRLGICNSCKTGYHF